MWNWRLSRLDNSLLIAWIPELKTSIRLITWINNGKSLKKPLKYWLLLCLDQHRKSWISKKSDQSEILRTSKCIYINFIYPTHFLTLLQSYTIKLCLNLHSPCVPEFDSSFRFIHCDFLSLPASQLAPGLRLIIHLMKYCCNSLRRVRRVFLAIIMSLWWEKTAVSSESIAK